MAALSHRAGRSSATQTFGTMHVDRRVLRMPGRTIVIANIATVSVGTHIEHRPRLLLWTGVIVLTLLAFGASQAGIAAAGKLNLISAALGLIAAALAIYALKPDDKTHYLLISSTDGGITRFAADDRTILEEARRILTEKINTGNEAAIFGINFESGVVENLLIANGGAHSTGPSAVATGYPGRSESSSVDPTSSASGPAVSAKPQPLNGAAQGSVDGYIDFKNLLPAIVEMQRFYARQPNAKHLEHRLSELELLMRAGAQTQGQRSRVRDLTKDLSHILQSYQPAVQIFQQISGMAA